MMKGIIDIKTIFVVLAVFYLVLTREVYAYLDPGTGSYILQLVIAGILGVLFAVKMFWVKVKSFFVNIFSRDNKHE
jgi:hypothetical protein